MDGTYTPTVNPLPLKNRIFHRLSRTGFRGVVDKASAVLSRLGLRDSMPGYDSSSDPTNATHHQASAPPKTVDVDKGFLENIQMYLRELGAVDRSGDEYADEKVYRHDDQYLQYMVSI